MNATERRNLSNEARMQITALKRIYHWRTASLAISAIGVALTYAGMAGANRNLFLGISGIIIIVLCTITAIILNLGVRNGKRNVEKILDILELK